MMQLETTNIVKYIILMIVFYLIFSIFTPLLRYKPVIDWWNNGSKGIDNADNFDVYALAYYEYFNIYYHIKTLFESENSKLSQIEVDFITTLINGSAQGLVPGGYFTPKMLCDTCVPDDFPNRPNSLSEWKNRLATWGATYDENGFKIDHNKWQSSTDNFLYYNMSIPGDAPIIVAFVTNRASDDSGELLASAIHPLFGTKIGPFGGILGFLRQGGNWGDKGINYVLRMLWTDDVPFKTNNSPPKPKCGSSSSVLGSISSGAGLGIAGVFIGGIPGLIVGILGTLIGSVSSLSNDGCF